MSLQKDSQLGFDSYPFLRLPLSRYTVCGLAGRACSVSGCQATCTVPTTTGYNTAGAGGTLTISGFSPTGVTCAAGYTGSVSYTVCGSAGTAYSVSGCQATWIVPTTLILSL